MYPACRILPYRFSFWGIYNNVTSAPLCCSLHPQVELLTRALYSELSFSPQDRRTTNIKRLAEHEENKNSSNCYVDTYFQILINLTFKVANEIVDTCINLRVTAFC